MIENWVRRAQSADNDWIADEKKEEGQKLSMGGQIYT